MTCIAFAIILVGFGPTFYLAAVMVITGYMVIFGKPRPSEATRTFIFTPMVDLVLFSLYVGAGIRFRREPAKHKRLMYLATFTTD